MFPTLNYLINYLFGTDIRLEFPPTFGALVALSFLVAAWFLAKEMKRKKGLGFIPEIQVKTVKGAPASISELLFNAFIGGFIGLKAGGLLIDGSESFRENPQDYILSSEGNAIIGLLGAAALALYTWYSKKKKALPQPVVETHSMSMGDLVSGITLNAAGYGILGAKIFHNLEYFSEFLRDPVGQLFSVTGLTFYGGLIGGFYGVRRFARKRGIATIHVADAVAPALMLAYGIGRIGCLLSGDGDWGIVNAAYRISSEREYHIISEEEFIQNDLPQYYWAYETSPEQVDYVHFARPEALSFMPHWFFAFDFPHNVSHAGVPISDCEGSYCNRLPLPVFPTMLYEFLMAMVMAGILWSLRKRLNNPGQLFGFYLILNGIERFLIEQIRVNAEMNLLGIQVTQAELIASCLMIAGIWMLVKNKSIQKILLKI